MPVRHHGSIPCRIILIPTHSISLREYYYCPNVLLYTKDSHNNPTPISARKRILLLLHTTPASGKGAKGWERALIYFSPTALLRHPLEMLTLPHAFASQIFEFHPSIRSSGETIVVSCRSWPFPLLSHSHGIILAPNSLTSNFPVHSPLWALKCDLYVAINNNYWSRYLCQAEANR